MQHLAVVMDGNRRWAKQRGLSPWLGHREGVQAAKRAVQFCLDKNIPYLSLYTFSLENFKRSQEELSFLFDVVLKEAFNEVYLLAEHGVRIKVLGDREKFPHNLRESIEKIEANTAHHIRLQLNLLFCYGAQQEIVSGVKAMLAKIKQGILREDEITTEQFSQCLWTQGIPEPELIIRSGGTSRLSNFLLYQAAYTELLFLDCMWPEVTREHLEHAITRFHGARRNFGT